jgi:sulfur carrier protein ThiS adenylyltransferase
MIAEAFHGAYPDRPLVMASGMAGHASGKAIRCRRLGRSTWVAGDLESAAGPGMGLMAPRVLIAAAQEANMVLRLLLGETEEESL